MVCSPHIRVHSGADGYGVLTHTDPDPPPPKAAQETNFMHRRHARHSVILLGDSHAC